MKLGSRFFASLLACSGLAASVAAAPGASSGGPARRERMPSRSGVLADTSPMGRLLASRDLFGGVPLREGLVLATREGLALADVGTGSLRHVGPPGVATAVASDGSGGLLACVGGRLVESFDGGRTFAETSAQLPGGSGVAVSLASSGERLLVGPKSGGVLVFDGSRWERAVKGFPASVGGRPVAVVRALSFVPGDERLAVGVTETMVVVRSKDGGLTWDAEVAIPNGGTAWRAGRPLLVAAGPEKPLRLFMARSKTVNTSYVPWELWQTDDGGATWSAVGKELELTEQVEWLRPVPGDPDTLEVATASSVYLVPVGK